MRELSEFFEKALLFVVYVGAIFWFVALVTNKPSGHWLIVLPVYAFFIVLVCGIATSIGKEFSGGCVLMIGAVCLVIAICLL